MVRWRWCLTEVFFCDNLDIDEFQQFLILLILLSIDFDFGTIISCQVYPEKSFSDYTVIFIAII